MPTPRTPSLPRTGPSKPLSSSVASSRGLSALGLPLASQGPSQDILDSKLQPPASEPSSAPPTWALPCIHLTLVFVKLLYNDAVKQDRIFWGCVWGPCPVSLSLLNPGRSVLQAQIGAQRSKSLTPNRTAVVTPLPAWLAPEPLGSRT